MIRSDNHVHTSFSSDSRESMHHMLEQAVSLHFSSICFTDHMDYDFPAGLMKTNRTEKCFVFDMDEYLNQIRILREQFPALGIRQGVELGLKPSALEPALQLTASYPLDFVIGSTHLVDNQDPYYPEFWEGYAESDAIYRYYKATLDNISLSFSYDVYGHLDYILRYSPTMKQLQQEQQSTDAYLETQCKIHAEIIEEILRQIIETGHGIEVNTAGLKYGMGHTNPHERILKRYRELGGEIITIGSDAHERKHLGYQFAMIPALLRQCGYDYYTEYHNRKPVMIPLQ